MWNPETSGVATQCLVALFVNFFDVVRSQLQGVLLVLTSFINSRGQSPASIGVAVLVRLAGDLGSKLSSDEWEAIFLSLKETVVSSLPGFFEVVKTMDNIEVPDVAQAYRDSELQLDHGLTNDDIEDDSLETSAYVVSRMKGHIAVQLLIIQVITELYKKHQQLLSTANVAILLEIFSSVAAHAHELNSKATLQLKLQKVCSILEVSEPPLVHFENESFQNYLNFMQTVRLDNLSMYEEMNIEPELVDTCEEIIQIYLNCSECHPASEQPGKQPVLHWILPLGSAKKEELAARTSLVVLALHMLGDLDRVSFRKYVKHFFSVTRESCVKRTQLSGSAADTQRNV